MIAPRRIAAGRLETSGTDDRCHYPLRGSTGRLNDRGVSSCDFNPQPSERFFQISVEITVGDRHHPGPKSPRLRRQQSDIAVGSQSLDAERLGLTRQQVNGVAPDRSRGSENCYAATTGLLPCLSCDHSH